MERKDMPGEGASPRLFPIVGIGASAGGLESLQRFLSALPKDFSFAPVFIQHLSSKHKSLLHELLSARLPSLVIQEISDGLKVQPGRLYLSPPGKEVRLRNGLFQTSVHPGGLVHLPIDEFFSSLAEDAGERSIAVIFSGAGTDGARGCQAVRSVGGSVFVQDPETAEFSSMPLAAIATGQADAVLSPENIAAELLKLQGIGAAVTGREYPITPEEYDGFFRLLQEKTSSRFNHYKKSVVSRRIRRRIYLHGLSSVKDYLDLIATNDSEAEHLASDLMIGVTSFFRDRVAWKALHLEAVRKIAAENTDLPVRVWTPASATGEEAYSIAMMLLRELALAGRKRDVQVFATDVNDRALERAREGKYPASIAADVQQEYIQKYFTSTDDDNFLVINKDVRESVVFARQDLLTDPPFSKLDLIICRNFMIYLEPEAQEKCIRLFHYALNNGGCLFLGNAETVGRNSRLFQPIGRKQCRVYRKLETKPASRLPISVPYAAERQATPVKQAHMTEQSRSIMEIIQEKLLEQYGPASVAIDQNCEIIYHNGPTNRYLLQPRGVPTQNLLELLPESLRSRIRGALYRSGREERPVAVRTSVAGDDNRTRLVSLRITKAAENIYLVVFQEKGARSKEAAAEQVDSAVIEETAIHQLETELSATRVHLQSYIEQLKSLNEELQSSNEELQAANEELETSREELQSLNEELITVNSQLQGKIEEQDETNNDLNNFLASTNIPTIFLDTHFRVKRFTPAMLKLIKLLPSDIGRPIVDMSQENLGPDLTSDAQAILEQLAPLRRELEIGSAWYVRTSLPYRTADNRIEGVVITYNDVTELKRAEERSRHLASFPQLNPNPVIEVDASGNVIFANPGTERMLESLGRGKGDVNVFLPEDLDAILKDLQKNSEFSVTREVAVKDRVFGETIQLVPQFNVVRIYTYDITERKKAEEIQGRLSAIVASAEDAIISKDLNGVIQTWNVGAEKIFGYTTEEVIGRNISLLIPPDHADEVPAILKRLTQGEHIENYETVRMRKDGTIVPVSLNFSAIRDSGGKVIGASKIAHDITERKLAEESLRESEEKFRGLFTWMGEAVQLCELVLDEGGGPIDVIIIDVNPAYEKETGLSRDKVVGRRIKEVLPVVEQVWLDRYGEIVRTGTPMHFEEYNASVDRWFNVYASPMKGNRFAVVFSDVTERKRAEEALRENEKQFRSLADSIPNLAWWANADGYITWYNRRWYEYTGTTPEQMEGWGWQSVHDPNVLPKVLERWQASITTGEPFGMEFPLRGSDGIFRSFLTRVMPLKDSEGKVLRWFGTNTDISALKQAEEVQGRLAAIVENAEDAIVGKDLNGIIQSWNVGAEKIFGYTAEEAIGKNVSILTPPGHTEDVPEILARINQGEHIESFETLRMRKDGTIIPVSLKFSAIKDASGKVIGASKIAHDISARKRAEEALRESDERVRRKLDSILSPEGDIGDLDLSDIIDAGAIQALIDDFYKLAHMPMSIIDLKGKMLVGAGWQQICTEFHRTHPETCRNCVESDLQLSAGVLPGAYKLYKCNNNMWDVATPIIVGGKHMGNLFMGQFFFEDEPLDYESFRAQARRYGFDEKQYIAALETVPRLSRDSLNTSMAFFMKLADILSKSSYGNLKLARSLAQRDALTGSLRESEDRLKRAQEISHVGSWELDLVNNRLTWSDEVYRIFGLQPQEFGATYEAFLEAVHPDDRAAVDAAYSRSIRDGRNTYEIEHRVVRKDAGEIRYVHEKCQHFRDETGRIIRSIGMVHDVTERKQAEEEIKQHIGELQAANEELARFNRAAVDRELRMIELKKEVNGLLKRAGQSPRFPLDFEKES